ncbi:MAG TPA: glycosyltransferase family 1 protein [bacterium]|nr:glycosyltransferase family 1 protein [bacterium]
MIEGKKWISCFADFSGYGSAARNYVFSLYKKGVPITIQSRNFDPFPPEVMDKEQKELLDYLAKKNIPYDKVIVHLTPDLYPLYLEKGKYNIGFCAWETSRLHPRWVDCCNLMSEMWVPCEYNVQAFRESGVAVPVYKIPHGIDVDMFKSSCNEQFSVGGINNSTFKFYSIFQWNARKNPEGLLRAYFNAFTENDDVVLILKTYLGNTGVDNLKQIRDKILYVKRDMNLSYFPKVVLISELLSSRQILELHKFGDAYISLHRGEGWNIPCFEAGLAGNPVIATGCGGNMEFMSEDNSHIVGFMWTYVSGMGGFNQWYHGNQQWASPNLIDASEKMRWVFSHREEAAEKGKVLSGYIKENFSWDKVSKKILGRFKAIDRR